MKVRVERKIDAAHFLPDYSGPCGRMHGHSWKIIVEIEGSVNPETGMVIDFRDVKRIIDELDHQLLNDFIEYPTAENLVRYLLDKLLDLRIHNPKIQEIKGILVRVYESEDCYVEESLEMHGGCDECGVYPLIHSATK